MLTEWLFDVYSLPAFDVNEMITAINNKKTAAAFPLQQPYFFRQLMPVPPGTDTLKYERVTSHSAGALSFLAAQS